MAKLQIKQLNSTQLITCDEQQQVNIIGGAEGDDQKYGYSYFYVIAAQSDQESLWKGYANEEYSIHLELNGQFLVFKSPDSDLPHNAEGAIRID
ncbi:MAG: hypothetical protein QNJ53_20190 [Pleurocapsa sp. MO_192.B19]|nr:hypothetical protein [Pleurocapsa sp. MO_192.B19]